VHCVHTTAHGRVFHVLVDLVLTVLHVLRVFLLCVNFNLAVCQEGGGSGFPPFTPGYGAPLSGYSYGVYPFHAPGVAGQPQSWPPTVVTYPSPLGSDPGSPPPWAQQQQRGGVPVPAPWVEAAARTSQAQWVPSMEGGGGVHNPGPPIQLVPDGHGPEGCNLFVFHIPNEMTNLDLFNYFAPFGNVLSARIMVDNDTGRSRGFGFVSFDAPECADAAITGMNGLQLGKKRLKVQHKKDKGSVGPGYGPDHAPGARGGHRALGSNGHGHSGHGGGSPDVDGSQDARSATAPCDVHASANALVSMAAIVAAGRDQSGGGPGGGGAANGASAAGAAVGAEEAAEERGHLKVQGLHHLVEGLEEGLEHLTFGEPDDNDDASPTTGSHLSQAKENPKSTAGVSTDSPTEQSASSKSQATCS